jgi:putative transposase
MTTRQQRMTELVEEHRETLLSESAAPTPLVHHIAAEAVYSERHIWRQVEKLRTGTELKRARFECEQVHIDAYLRYGAVAPAYNSLAPRDRPGSLPTFRRAIDRCISVRDKAALTKGHAAVRATSVALPGLSSVRNEIWEIDNCQLALAVMEDGAVAKEVWVIAVIDHRTRVLLDFELVTRRPRGTDIARLIVRASLGHVTKHGVLIGGAPDRIVTDQGQDYLSATVQQSADQLRSLLHPLDGYSPHLKGRIERFFGTFATDCINALPGRTNLPETRDGKPASDHRAIEASVLEEHLQGWVRSYNEDRLHRSLGMTPEAAWSADPTPLRHPTVDQVMTHLGAPISRIPTIHGVQLDNHFYKSDALSRHASQPVRVRQVEGARCVEVWRGAEYVGRAHRDDQMSPDDKDQLLKDRRAAAERQTELRQRQDSIREDTLASVTVPAQPGANGKGKKATATTRTNTKRSSLPDNSEALETLMKRLTGTPVFDANDMGQGQFPLGVV